MRSTLLSHFTSFAGSSVLVVDKHNKTALVKDVEVLCAAGSIERYLRKNPDPRTKASILG